MHRTSISMAVIGCICALVLLAAGCKRKATADKPRPNPPTAVDVMVASLTPITDAVEANGTVLANEAVEIRPEVSGRLTYLNVPEGRLVSQGTVLARINSADLAAQLQKSRVQLELAEKNEQRLKQLLDVQGINQADYDAVLNQVNSLRADIAYTQTLIDKTVIRAPFTGTVGLKQVSPGAYVSSANVIATIQQLSKTKIDFTLPEQYSDLVKVGDKVAVRIDAGRDSTDFATIIAMEPQVNTQTRNMVVRAVLTRANANPGAFVKVYVGTENNKQAIVVPTNTIIPDDRNSQLIVVKGGKAKFVNVKTGLRQAGNIEITSGINAGDTVVVTGVLFARPDAPLKIRSVKKLEQL